MSNNIPVMVMLVVVIVLQAVAIHLLQPDNKDLVYSACNESRISDTVTEETCGYLQDRYNMEFLCKENNKDSQTQCWVEEK